MPTYEFKCNDPRSPYHEKPLEIIMSDKDYEEYKKDPRCPVTNAPLIRIFSPSIFKFKGSGFHNTDYGKYGPKE
jgi:predicted nucleic acid-binding Zn ribbon protein